MRGVVKIGASDGLRALKHYHASDTARFQCWGSGSRNEAFVERAAPGHVPRLRAYRRQPGGDEEAELEWIDGEVVDARDLGEVRLRHAGEMLARIHQVSGSWFGSLDGRFRFETQVESFQRRWEHALRLFEGTPSHGADRLRHWGSSQLAQLSDVAPALVHGDFGARNLLWGSGPMPAVLDWEHSRFGDFREDWAKIDLASRFAEPNACFVTASDAQAFRDAYASASPNRTDADPPLIYMAYFAVVLATFFRDDRRLTWLWELIGAS